MNKTLILSCIFLLVLSSFAIAVDTGNLTETNENITLYFDNTGTLTKNYPGFFNVTWNSSQGWAKVNNGSVIVTYNVSSGESWALYQDPTTCVMPSEDKSLTTNQNSNLCNGKWGLKDTNANGALIVGASNIIVECNNAQFFGNLTTNSMGIYSNNRNNVTIQNCNITGGYKFGIDHGSNTFSGNNSIINSSFIGAYSYSGLYIGKQMTNIITGNYFKVSSGRGLATEMSDYTQGGNIYKNNIFIENGGGILVTLTGTAQNFTGNYLYNSIGANGVSGLNLNNSYFEGNLVSNTSVKFTDSNSNLIRNNLFDMDLNSASASLSFLDSTIISTNNNVTGNNFTRLVYSLRCGSAGVNYFENNNFFNSTSTGLTFVNLDNACSNAILRYNFYNVSAKAISCQGCKQITIQNETINNMIINYDNWNVGIFVFGGKHITIKNINHPDYVVAGVSVVNSSNITIQDSYFDQMTDANLISKQAQTLYFPTAAIQVATTLTGWYTTSTQNISKDNISVSVGYNNYNVTLSNISFGNNVKTFLIEKGTTNFNFDSSITNYWLRSFQIPYLYNRTYFYNNNLFDVITTHGSNTASSMTGLLQDGGNCGSLSTNCIINYGMSKTLMNFTVHPTLTTVTPNLSSISLSLYNLTPPYNDIRINGVVSALNQPNYSITLNPGDLVEVSDFTYCGDGIVQSPNDNSSFMEDCDGANLNSQTCLSVGFTKGTLSCNSCSFVTTDCQAKSQLCQDNLVPLSGMTTWLGLLVTIICIAFVFIIFTDNSINIKMEGNTFYTTVLIIISVGFLIGVGILILSNLC